MPTRRTARRASRLSAPLLTAAALLTGPAQLATTPQAEAASRPSQYLSHQERTNQTTARAMTLAWSLTTPSVNVPIAESAPTIANLDGTPSIVVGDRGGTIWALHLADGTTPKGWPVRLGAASPIDSPISAARLKPTYRRDAVFVGAGTDGTPSVPYGFNAFGPAGQLRWHQVAWDLEVLSRVFPPSAPINIHGVNAGITLFPTSTGFDAVAGTTGQYIHDFNALTGAPRWDYLSADSVHSTFAWADLHAKHRIDLVTGGDSTANPVPVGNPPFLYHSGGHLRIMNATAQPDGTLYPGSATATKRCELLPQPTEVLDSSPAIGPFLPGGAIGIVSGTGDYYPNASAFGVVLATDTRCHLAWTARIGGSTVSSPALADVTGSGHLAVLALSSTGTTHPGNLWALDEHGAPLPHYPVTATAPIYGTASPVTVDLGAGHQDIVVPTLSGLDVFDGLSGHLLDVLAPYNAFQNTPVVATDPATGLATITAAGYTASTKCPGATSPCLRSIIWHWVTTSTKAIDPAVSWPMFHHDPYLSGSSLTGLNPTQTIAPAG